MHVVHETPSLFEIHSPAVFRRFEAISVLVISVLMCVVATFCVVVALWRWELKASFEIVSVAIVCGPLGVLGVFAGISIRGKTYDIHLRFDGNSECLIVTHDKVRRIHFSRIVKAEVFIDGDEDTGGYALRVVTLDETIQAHCWLNDPEAFQLLAERINQFLGRYRPNDPSVELPKSRIRRHHVRLRKSSDTSISEGEPK